MNSARSSTIDVSLLGRFELRGASGPISLTSKKVCALLAYLACGAPEAQHARDKLLTLLWGSHFERQARQNLRQALVRLRRVLGPNVLITDGETVSLQAGSIVCDVSRFETLVREQNCQALVEATKIYKDRFLAGLAISEEGWSDWLRTKRQQLEDLAVDAMVRLAEQYLRSRNAEDALASAKRAIAINGLREDAHRLAIRATAATGNRGLALKRYDELISFLRRELDVGPDAATQALAAQLRRSSVLSNFEPPSPYLPIGKPHRIGPHHSSNVDWHAACAPKWRE